MTNWGSAYGSSSGGGSTGGGTGWGAHYGGSGGAVAPSGGGGLFDKIGGIVGSELGKIPGEHYVGGALRGAAYIGGNAASQGEEVVHSLPSAPMNLYHLLDYSLSHNYGSTSHAFRHPLWNIEQAWNDPKNLLDQWVHQPANDVGNLFSAKGRHYEAQHPLNLPLDLLAVADPAGRVAARAGRAGVLGKAAQDLATAPRVLTDSSGGYSAFLRKAHTLHGMALQKAFDNFSTSHPELRYFGNDARLARRAATKSYYQTQTELSVAREFQKAGNDLTNPEKFAFHVAAEPLALQDRIALFTKLNEMHPSAGLRKYVSMLKDPAVADVLQHPRADFLQAVERGRQLEAKAGDTLVRAGRLTPEIRAERAQLPAQTFEDTMGFKPGPRSDIHESFGDPFRFPHVGTTKTPSVFSTPLAPLKGVRTPGLLKKNRGLLFAKAQLITDPAGVYSQDYMRTHQWLHKLDLQEHVYDHVARELDPAMKQIGGKPEDGAYYWPQHAQEEAKAADLKNRKIPREVNQAPELARDRAILDQTAREKEITDATNRTMFDTLPKDLEDKSIAELQKLGVKWVPAKWADAYKREFQRTNAFFRVAIQRPVDYWRALTLKYRPAWAVNNLVGQHLMYAMNAEPGAAKAYISALKMRQEGHDLTGVPGAEQGFAHTQSHVTRPGFAQPIVDRSAIAKTVRALGKPAEWALKPIRLLGDANLYINQLGEQIPRDAAILKAAKDRGFDIRAVQKISGKMEAANHSLAQALKDPSNVALTHAVEDANDMLGDFGRLSHIERTYIRSVFPFYAWFKVITVLTGKYILRHPLRVKMLQLLSEHQKENDAQLPSWLKGAIPFGNAKNGNQPMLSTTGLNPFETLNQLGPSVGGLFHGKTKFGSDNPGGLMNPFLSALITGVSGQDTFTGSAYKGPGANQGILGRVAGNVASGLPEYQLAEKAAGAAPPSSLYSQQDYYGLPPYLWNYLGLPIRRVNKKAAKARAQAGD